MGVTTNKLRAGRRGWMAAGVAAALMLAVTGCGGNNSDSKASGGLTKVNFVIPSASANQALGYIASSAGIFKKNGLDVKTSVAGAGSLTVAALVSGSADFVITGGSDLWAAQEKGQKVDILGKALTGQATQLVLTNAAAQKTGLTASSSVADKVKALNGLTIASPSEASSWTVQANKAAATENATIKWTYIQPPAMAAAMKSGNIDGIVAAPPFTTDPVFQKTGVLWLSGPDKTFPGGFDDPDYGDPLIATSASYLASHKSTVEAFYKSMLQTVQYIQNDPTLAGQDLKKAVYPTMTDTEFNQMWQTMLPLLKDCTFTEAQIQKTMDLEGANLKAADVYPSDVISAVGNGS